jgi:hypothetical protein
MLRADGPAVDDVPLTKPSPGMKPAGVNAFSDHAKSQLRALCNAYVGCDCARLLTTRDETLLTFTIADAKIPQSANRPLYRPRKSMYASNRQNWLFTTSRCC